jgi:membrane protein CcdC involved in cytochrome C biogenesis
VHIGFGTSAVGAVLGLLGVLAWRIREGRTTVTVKKIIMPPLGMATGFCMFLVPTFRVPWTWALAAFLVGMIALAYPLLITSKLVRTGNTIMMQRSNAFFLVVIALAAIRYFARGYFDRIMSLDQTAGLFFVLAFGMILRWRLRMLSEYRALTARISMPA